MRLFSVGLIFFVFSGCSFHKKTFFKEDKILYSWTQLVSGLSGLDDPLSFKDQPNLAALNFKAIARSITLERECPQIFLDGKALKMKERGTFTERFPIQVCELEIPLSTQEVLLNGEKLPVPVLDPKKILVIGDTGCRIQASQNSEYPARIQNCGDLKSWPFQTIAISASKQKPDLIIHVGDYLYRESPCPDTDKGCQGSSFGDQWNTWNSDFFMPVKKLLNKAPWIFVRGNHESCARAGRGWQRLLDPFPYQSACSPISEPYVLSFNALRMFVLDSAMAEDTELQPEIIKIYKAQFEKIRKASLDSFKKNSLSSSPPNPPLQTWILSHRPIWSGSLESKFVFKKINQTLQKALDSFSPENFKLVLSGHVHLFEALSFFDQGPLQVIIGNSGTQLDVSVPSLEKTILGGRQVRSFKGIREYGYAIFKQEDATRQWHIRLYNQKGHLLEKIPLKEWE